MAIPPDVARISLIGHLPQGELFNTSFWVYATTIDSAAKANQLASDVQGIFSGIGSNPIVDLLATGAGYDQVRVYGYPLGGPTADFIGSAAIVTGQGTGATSNLPLQTCLVASLGTGFAGRRHRGRMYLPWIKGSLTAHQTNSTHINQVATALKTLFDGVNALATVANVAIVSQVGAGSALAVTTITVDSKPDVQRRHANRQAAAATFTSTLAA